MKPDDKQSRPGQDPKETGRLPVEDGVSHRVAYMVLAIALAASAGGWFISRALEARAARDRVVSEAGVVRAAIQERLAVYESVLRGANGLFAASTSVEREEWRAYLDRVLVGEVFPGIGAVGYAEYVKSSRTAAEGEARAARGEQLIVKFLEPELIYQDLIGMDLRADPEREETASRARLGGEATISHQMILYDAEHGGDATGFLMMVPVYAVGVPTGTASERQENCLGVVYARLMMGRLMKEVLRDEELRLRVEVFDQYPGQEDAVVYQNADPDPGFTPRWIGESSEVLVGGRQWRVRLSSTPEYEGTRPHLASSLVAATGSLVSLLLFGIAWSLSHTRERAVVMAAGMTSKLRRANETLQREIVDREKAQRDIRDSEALYHSLVESLPMNIVRKDLKGRYTFANQRFCNDLGKSQDEVLGGTDFDVFPDYLAALQKQEDARIMEAGTNLEAVHKQEVAGEAPRFLQTIKTPLRDGMGEVIGLQVIFWDVTDKHRMEEDLQRERDFLHLLLDNVPDRIYFKDDQSRFMRVSSAMVEMFRVSDASEVVGKTDFDFFSEVHARQAYDAEQEIIRTGKPVIDLVERVELSDGKAQWALTTKMPMRDASGRVVGTFGITRDITPIKAAEAELEHERDLLHTLLDNLPDRIYFKDLDSRFLRVGRALADLHLLADPSEAIGKTDFDFFTKEHAQQAYDDEQRIIRTGEPIIGLVEKETLPGEEVRWGSTTKMPLRNKSGAIVGTFGITRDITEMKKAAEALREAKEAAEEASRTKSQFLANMSHELRTPLNSIIGFSNILAKNKSGNLRDTDLNFLGRILSNGKHLLELINQILDLSKIEARRVEVNLSAVSLGELIRETVEQQEGLVRDRPIQLVWSVPEGGGMVETDRDKLKQVLINLIGNALKFTTEGAVTVRVVMDQATHRPQCIEVEDTGIGIPKEKLATVFQAFQQADASTARKFGGTGLGLTISQALCRLMGYDLRVSSEEGRGSTFTVVLRSDTDQETESESESVPRGMLVACRNEERDSRRALGRVRGKRVLVIDDEADSRMLLRHTLEEFGCVVEDAGGGGEGMRRAREFKPDLITVDLMMPRMTGAEVVSAIKSDPELKFVPVVVVSIVAGEHRGHILGAVDFLEKPVSRTLLLETLERNLPRAGGRVLVVDDDEDARLLMRSLLEAERLTVETASNGVEGLKVLGRSRFDLVVLDLMMPEMDGFAFLERLRSSPDHRGMPVVVVSAKELSNDEMAGLRRCTNEIVKKSGDFESDFLGYLRHVLELPCRAAGGGGRGAE